jgi:hypothetical protein
MSRSKRKGNLSESLFTPAAPTSFVNFQKGKSIGTPLKSYFDKYIWEVWEVGVVI